MGDWEESGAGFRPILHPTIANMLASSSPRVSVSHTQSQGARRRVGTWPHPRLSAIRIVPWAQKIYDCVLKKITWDIDSVPKLSFSTSALPLSCPPAVVAARRDTLACTLASGIAALTLATAPLAHADVRPDPLYLLNYSPISSSPPSPAPPFPLLDPSRPCSLAASRSASRPSRPTPTVATVPSLGTPLARPTLSRTVSSTCAYYPSPFPYL